MSRLQAKRNWNERYLVGDTPWAAHELLKPVLDIVQRLCPNAGTILEVGCGYGQEAIALANLGYSVTAIDLSDIAIQQAQINAQREGLNIHFQAFDLLHDQLAFHLFDFILDIAVLHTMENTALREKFSQKIACLLKPGAIWINVSCLLPNVLEVAENAGVKAPPALSKAELQQISGKNNFTREEEHLTSYQILREDKLVAFPALISVFKKK
jgi:2-polyprenyl-3-methyl-5-hydroxy-6-metoxy-1,4-benzoquinol methylase